MRHPLVDGKGLSLWRASGAAVAVLSVAAVALVACGDGEASGPPKAQVRAVTSLELFADMVRQVGGARVEAKALLPSGADPHTFELAPNRVADVAQADVVFFNGLGLEGNLEDVIEQNAGGPAVALTAGLETLDGNPHLWLDVRLASRYVEQIRDTLIDVDPEGREQYEENARAYLGELDALDRELEAAIQSVPEKDRTLVTFHDAFPYMAERYGLTIAAVVVPSPGQEPSAQEVAELTETLRSQGAPAAFKEPQFNARVLELAASDAGVRVLDLLSDAYAEGVDSYVGLMRFNMRQLQEGLGGN